MGSKLLAAAGIAAAARPATVVVPAYAGRAVWTNPATGRTLASHSEKAGRQTFAVPAFTTDIALKIVSS